SAFGLLVDAHYRTSPADLRQWLDDPAARSWRARIGDRTVGVLWCAHEGGLSQELAEQVSLGTRRIRGHLLPQSLASHSGYPEAAVLGGLRVVRIAVSDDARRLGIGHSLVEAARAYTVEQGVDYLGTSFGGSADLLAFWLSCGLHVVRIGLQREASSGEYPLQMISGVSQPGLELEGRIRNRLAGHWLTLVPDNWHGLDPEMLAGIAADLPSGPALDADDLRDLRNFANGHRGFQVMVPVLRKLSQAPGVVAWLRDQDTLTLWCRSVLQGCPWSSLQAEKLCQGQREGEDHLRLLVRDLLEDGPGL
ncbi:MAG: GNAT family N-acetyltransferase, partial [Marinobacter sp.]|nr:GNAT family N-acetyltransferase [Marinobacter sp.]